MSKRKLSRQQAWRVEKIQEERARRAAKRDAEAEQALAGGELGPEREGLVIAHYGTQVAVESSPGDSQRCHMRANLEGLVTGDRVVWCEGEPTGVVVAQLERDTVLSRPDPYGKLKPVAANIDQIMLVIAPFPTPHANLVNRYLVAAETVGIEPVIVLNKTDLLDDDPQMQQQMEELHFAYQLRGRWSAGIARGPARAHQRIRGAVRGGQVVTGECAVTRCRVAGGGAVREHPEGHPYHHHGAAVSPGLRWQPYRLARYSRIWFVAHDP